MLWLGGAVVPSCLFVLISSSESSVQVKGLLAWRDWPEKSMPLWPAFVIVRPREKERDGWVAEWSCSGLQLR